MGPTEYISRFAGARFDAMQKIGCVVTAVYFTRFGTPGQIHHLKSGNKRIGHLHTICLTPWYHEGEPPVIRYAGGFRQLTVSEATRMLGPGLKHNPKQFHERFGTDEDLLEMQNALLDKYQELEQAA